MPARLLHRLVLLARIAVVLTLTPLVASPLPAQAASLSFAVTSTTDAPDANPGDGLCASIAGGACTLRAAIQEANAPVSGGVITITLPAGTYPLTLGALNMAQAIHISGAGSTLTTVTAHNLSTVFTVATTARVSLEAVTVAAGNAGSGAGGGISNAGVLVLGDSVVSGSTAASGGGIQNSGTLGLENSTVTGNTAQGPGGGILNQGILAISNTVILNNVTTGDSGGGIYNAGSAQARVIRSTISNNTAGHYYGGGIHNSSAMTVIGSIIDNNVATGNGGGINNNGTLTVLASTIAGNTAGCADGRGGGIENSAGHLTLVASTISGNQGCYRGGAIENTVMSTLLMVNSTISGNNGSTTGGGIENNSNSSVWARYSTISNNTASTGGDINNGSGLVSLTGSIVANPSGANCSGPITEGQGYNLDSGASCGLSQPTDLTNVDPLLGPLANHGGPTATIAPVTGSPVLNRGGTRATGCPATDQRGVSRPQGPACDIGAYESGSGTASIQDTPLQ